MDIARRRRSLIALCIAAMLGLVAVVIAESNSATAEASNGYQAQRSQFEHDVQLAQGNGYTPEDLMPVTTHLGTIEATGMPLWIGDRPGFYREQTLAMAGLREELAQRQHQVLDQAVAATTADLNAAGTQVGKDRDLGVDADVLDPLMAKLNTLNARLTASTKIAEVRALGADARAMTDDAAKAGAAQQAENDAITAVASQLKAQPGVTPDSLRRTATAALNSARNDATVAGFLNMESNFSGIADLNRAYGRVEKYTGRLAGADLDTVAFGTAAIQRYGKQVHELMVGGIGGPGKAFVVSLADQELWAYEKGKSDPVLDTVVTTGRPALTTDVGPMQVLRKNTPWKMESPWPKESPFYYPPTDVRKVLWFTNTGEGLHDAPWRDWFGPGSNVGDGTHGCVNMPGSTIDFAYAWAPVGTPVIVIPGDFKTQQQQLAEDTIDTPSGQSVKGA